MANNGSVTLDTLIAIKIQFQGHTKKFKIPLRDLGAQVLPEKLRTLLQISPDEDVVFERYSDSAGAYVTLDSDKPQVYKTLFRAAKAKLKLRLRATLVGDNQGASLSPSAEAYREQTRSLRTSHIPVAPVSPLVEPSPAIAHSPPVTYAKGKQAVVSNMDNDDEAPVPRPFPTRERFLNELAEVSHNLALRPKEPEPSCSWIVYCNHCEQPMESEHFHCSICENGDYDLCPACVDSGVHCPGAGHWMVKRFVQNGIVVNSTTERVGPKPKVDAKKEMPGSFKDERKTLFEPEQPTRTCNSCVKVFPENQFVTCTTCEDYDLCLDCHTIAKHGHHPGHAFQGATPETNLTAVGEYLCNAGRNVRHSAVCDGCEKFIYGVRHKCLNCPDWDFCSECIKSAKYIHPRHRFVPIYEPLTEPTMTAVRHYGIYCDGPLCKDKDNVSYIEGVRFKCAVCHDLDFCANCEAFPHNRHNRTHPLIKFKTPVRSVSVTTMGEDKNGVALSRMGDQPAQKSAATETIPVAPSTNAATQVQTIVDLKPTEETQCKPNKEKIEIKDLLSEPLQEVELTQEKIKVTDLLTSSEPPQEEATQSTQPEVSPKAKTKKPELDAHFVRDTITDGTKVFASFQFVQVWTLRNPGPLAWPAGCSVRHVGGDNMLNLDNTQPLSQSELAEASESNVMGRPVDVGEEISFRIVMRAPKRQGTAISYWRLKTADGTPFGHRLWCDIQVTTPPTPITQSSPVPEASGSNSIPRELVLERIRKAKEQVMKVAESNTRAKDVAVIEQLNPHIAPLDHERMQQIQQIQQFKKAALERLYESRRKAMPEEAARATFPRDRVISEEPVKSVPVAEEPAEKEPAHELRPQPSGMIFPQLDKESPVSSTHEAIDSKSESQEVKSDAAPASATSESGEEFFEDAESVEILDTSSDDGFMTDEEYDILDASDEEMP